MLICGRHWWHQSIGFVSFGAKQYPFIKQELFFNKRNKSAFIRQCFTADLRVPLAWDYYTFVAWSYFNITLFFCCCVYNSITSNGKEERHSICLTGYTLKYRILSQASDNHVTSRQEFAQFITDGHTNGSFFVKFCEVPLSVLQTKHRKFWFVERGSDYPYFQAVTLLIV